MKHLHLIIMSRAPVSGRTKTRLIPALGPDGARDFHVACLNDLLQMAEGWLVKMQGKGIQVTPHLAITPPESQEAFRAAGVRWPEPFIIQNQQGEKLGERMAQAITEVLGEGQPDTGVLLIGSDLPLLGERHLDWAARSLDTADVVLGPTMDGGYYLVGMNRFHPSLFAIGDWGGATVLDRTLEAARAEGLRTALLSRLPDVDTGEDLRVILAHAGPGDVARSAGLRYVQENLATELVSA